MWLLVAVVAGNLGWRDWGKVCGCALADRKGLEMWLGLGICCCFNSGLGAGYLEMSCCISQMFPGPEIMFALGVYMVGPWCESSVNQGCIHFLLGKGTIPLGQGLVASSLWHCGLYQSMFLALLLCC